MAKKNLPLYNLTVEDGDNGFWLSANSFVDEPAHRLKYLVFNKQGKVVKQHFNEEQRIVMGVVIATDTPIYRRDDDGREYFVQFDETNTKKIAHRALKSGAINIVNLDHDGHPREGAYLVQSIIVDSKVGISAPEAFADQNLKDGSWIVGYKVEDDELWEQVRKRKGFSVEVFVNEQLVNHNIQIQKQIKMKKMKRMTMADRLNAMWKEVFGEQRFEETVADDGTVVRWDGELDEGTIMYTPTEEGDVILPAGTYLLPELAVSVTVGDEGEVTAIVPVVDDIGDDFEKAMKPVLQSIKRNSRALENLQKQFNAHIAGGKKFGARKTGGSGGGLPPWRNVKK